MSSPDSLTRAFAACTYNVDKNLGLKPHLIAVYAYLNDGFKQGALAISEPVWAKGYKYRIGSRVV